MPLRHMIACFKKPPNQKPLRYVTLCYSCLSGGTRVTFIQHCHTCATNATVGDNYVQQMETVLRNYKIIAQVRTQFCDWYLFYSPSYLSMPVDYFYTATSADASHFSVFSAVYLFYHIADRFLNILPFVLLDCDMLGPKYLITSPCPHHVTLYIFTLITSPHSFPYL